MVEPFTGIAPFSNCAPSAGESTVSAGASATLNGTVMNTRAGVSAVLPVSASSALMSNWLRPRRSSTSTCQLPAESADSRYGWSLPAAVTVIVALGIEVPRSVYTVASSATSTTAVAGSVTASVGGFANRISCTPRKTANTAIRTVSSAATTTAGENVRPWRGASSGLGTASAGSGGDRRVAALALPLADDVLGVEAEIQRVVAQEALGVDGARQLGVLAVLERGQVARADLRVALGPVEVDALTLARRVEPLGQRRTGVGGEPLAHLAARPDATPSQLVSRGHASSSSLACTAVSSRRRTIRAFEPSNAPTYPRASSWSMIRAARA